MTENGDNIYESNAIAYYGNTTTLGVEIIVIFFSFSVLISS